MNKNKTKGKYFENKTAGVLRLHWNLTSDECHRAQSSGTFKSDYSDVIIRPFKYKLPCILFECKYRTKYPIRRFLNPKGDVKDWWNQVSAAGKQFEQTYFTSPLKVVVFGIPGIPSFAIVNKLEFESFIKDPKKYNCKIINKNYLNKNSISFFTSIKIGKNIFNMYYFSEFLSNIQLIKV